MSSSKHEPSVWWELLNQEPTFTQTQYAEYRQKLQGSLKRVTREATVVRRTAFGVWGLSGSLLVAGAVVDFNRTHFPEIVRLSLGAATATVMVCALVISVIYLLRYRPRIWRTEQAVLLEQLRRELEEVRDRLPPSSP